MSHRTLEGQDKVKNRYSAVSLVQFCKLLCALWDIPHPGGQTSQCLPEPRLKAFHFLLR